MPFKREEKIIYKQESDGEWIIKQRCNSTTKAKAALRLLEAWETEEKKRK